MLQKPPVNNFQWVKDTPQFNKDFIKNYNEESDEGNFLEFDVQYIEELNELHYDLPKKLKKSKSLYLIYMIILNMLFT